MKNHTRIDIFRNADEVLAFYEWAEQFQPKTKQDMEVLLARYKKADLVVQGYKEHVEHQIVEGLKGKKHEQA